MGPETLVRPGESPAQTLSLWLEEIGSSLIISSFHSWFTHQGGEQSLGIICREFLSELPLTILSYISQELETKLVCWRKKIRHCISKPNGNECEDCNAITFLLLVYFLNVVK